MIDIFLSGVIKAVLWYNYYTIKSDSFDVELVDVLEGLEAKSIAFSAFIYFPLTNFSKIFDFSLLWLTELRLPTSSIYSSSSKAGYSKSLFLTYKS